jgi:hypothetical protein
MFRRVGTGSRRLAGSACHLIVQALAVSDNRLAMTIVRRIDPDLAAIASLRE